MQKPLNQPPLRAEPGGREWFAWFNQMHARLSDLAQILWAQLDFTGSKLTDIATRNHADLQSIGQADDTSTDIVKDKHVSNAMMKAIPDHTGAITAHTGATTAHGSTGAIVGNLDYATAVLGGVVLKATAVTDAIASTVSVASPDSTDLATVITLANELKADVNTLVSDVNLIKTQLNALLAAERTAKQVSP